MAQLPTGLPPAQQTTRWKAILDPVIAAPMVGVSIIGPIALKLGANVINHRLGQTQQGWFLTDVNGGAQIYRSAPFNDKTLTLTSDAAVTVNIGVF